MAVLDTKGIFCNNNDQVKIDAAIAKLEETEKSDLKDIVARVIFQPTLEVLIDFCQQDVRFADAVLRDGKSLPECLAQIAKGVDRSISDLEVYRKAVQYYLPDAQISMQLSIFFGSDVKPETAPEPVKKKPAMILNLLDF